MQFYVYSYYLTIINIFETGGTLNVGVMLLSSCWKHYVMLLRLEDPRFSQNYMELLDQYISAIQVTLLTLVLLLL